MAFHHSQLEGIVTATPTPVRPNGSIDTVAAAAVARHVVEGGGVSAIAPIGGTGEYTALTPQQRRAMLDVTIETVAGRIPVIAGVLSPGIGEALEAVRAYSRSGADMIMLVTPYYARPIADGMVDYFKAIADATDLPLMLYEIPYRTGVQLSAETVAHIVDEAGVVAMKTCSHDLSYQMRLLEFIGEKATVLTGEENVFPAHVAIGAKGGFLASSLLFPRAWEYLYKLASAGRNVEAVAFHRRLMPYVTMLFREHNPAPIKAALDIIGMPQGQCLPPLRSASDETRQLLQRKLPEAMKIEAEARAALLATR